MSETKPTPGPWSIGTSADHTPAVTVPAEGFSGFVVAHINRVPRMRGVSGDMDANARLIAAAPDMLEALQDILRISRHDSSLLCVARIVDAARAAIAKAEGRS